LEWKYVDVQLHDYIIMPNHFHSIIQKREPVKVGADLCVCPKTVVNNKYAEIDKSASNMLGDLGEHIGSPLHQVVQWFKTMTTNGYIKGVKQYEWQPL
jgi:putative transposase